MVPATALVGGAALIFATAWGIGLSHDPVIYVSMARGFLGSPSRGWSGDMVHFQPLYPAVLAICGAGSDPLLAARWVNSALFAVNISLVGLLAWRASGQNAACAAIASVLTLTSTALITVHSQAWSEPLFLSLTLASLYFLASHFDVGSPGRLISAGLLASMALMTRYVGLALVAAGVVALLTFRHDRTRRVREAAIFGLTACLPEAAWVVRRMISSPGSSATDRHLVLHLVSGARLADGLTTMAAWVVPRVLPPWPSMIVAGVAGGAMLLLTRRVRRQRRAHTGNATASSTLPALLGVFLAIYVAFLLIAISLASADTPLDDRILSPVWVTGLIAILGLIGQPAPDVAGTRALAGLGALLGLSAMLANTGETVAYLRTAHARGIGYASRGYVESRLVQYVRRLPPGTVIVTNAPQVIYIHSGRDARRLPAKYNPSTLEVNREFASQLRRLETRAAKGPLAIVYFQKRRRDHLPTREELSRALPLVLVREFKKDGAVYAIRPRADATSP